MAKTSNDSFKALKGTTFSDLFQIPETHLNPVTEEEFLEDAATVAYSILFNIIKDIDTPVHTKVAACKLLIERAKGMPTTKAEVVVKSAVEEMSDAELDASIRSHLKTISNDK